MMKYLRKLSLHPFLFAALIVVISLSQLKEHAFPEEMIAFLVGLETLLAIFFGVLTIFLGAPRAGLVSTLVLIAFFCFQIFSVCIDAVSVPEGSHAPPWISLSLFAVGLWLWSAMLVQKQWKFTPKIVLNIDHESLCQSLNLVSLVLLVINLVSLVSFEIEDNQVQRKMIAKMHEPFSNLQLNQSAEKPDVYYIIVDMCANTKTLKDFWGYDNKQFLEFLKSKGFYLPEKAFSNYDRTSLSLSSSLNAQYLTDVTNELGKNWIRTSTYYKMAQESAVATTFKRLGYKFVNVFSGTAATSFLPYADVNVMTTWNTEYYTMMLRFTPLFAIEKYYPLLRNWYAETRLAPGKVLPQVMDVPGPKFVLIHCTLTHAPFIFNADGSPRPLAPEFTNEEGPPENYVNQVKFSESEIQRWIEKLQNQPKKPVIIVQADHGPFFLNPPLHYFNQRMRILNAYYLPGMNDKGLYENISPVNTFRVVLNDYFDAKLPILKDASYCTDYGGNALEWNDVTGKLVFGTDQVPEEKNAPMPTKQDQGNTHGLN